MFAHTSLGFCIWDIPALIVLIAVIVVFIAHRHNQKKREKDFEDQLAEKLAKNTVEQEETVEA